MNIKNGPKFILITETIQGKYFVNFIAAPSYKNVRAPNIQFCALKKQFLFS